MVSFSSLRAVEFDFLNNLSRRVFHNYELVSNYPVNNFLLFVLRQSIDKTSTVKLGFTALFAFATIQNLINIDCLIATTIFISTTRAKSNFCFRRLFVKPTVAHFCYRVKILASIATYQIEIAPDLPVDFFPTDTVSFSDKGDKLF